MKSTKKFKKINTELDLNSTYDPDKAFEILKKEVKFNQLDIL